MLDYVLISVISVSIIRSQIKFRELKSNKNEEFFKSIALVTNSLVIV